MVAEARVIGLQSENSAGGARIHNLENAAPREVLPFKAERALLHYKIKVELDSAWWNTGLA
ncbi:MAG: hypothetical protein ACLPTF_22735 [Steroidobacteraceae bacterium]